MMEKKAPLIFHSDWFDIINDLPEELQLEAYQAIMRYAFTGEKPENPYIKAIVALMLKFIDIDRDKYEKAIQQRKDAIRKRWDKQKNKTADEQDFFDSNTAVYNTNTSTTTSTTTNTKTKTKTTAATAANNISRKGASGAEAAADVFGLEDRIAELKKRPKWIEQLAKRFKISQAEIIRRLDEFRDDMEIRGKVVNNPQSLFVTWLGDLKKSAKPDEPAEPNFGPGEFRNAKGERTYSKGIVIVPEDAPPRPGNGFYWHRITKSWCEIR